MRIIKAKIKEYLVVNVETDSGSYDKDFFYNNFNYDTWNIYWDESIDISVDELECYSKGIIYAKN